jgi:hypothetical protein
VPPAAVFPRTIDLGDRELGEVVVAKFTVRNEGGNPLAVSHFRASCACAGVEQETDGVATRIDQVVVPARSSVDLQVRIAIRGQPGHPERTSINFVTNDPMNPKGVVTIEPSRVLGIACTPKAVLFDGVLSQQPLTRVIEVRNIGDDSPKIEAVTTNSPTVVRARLLTANDLTENAKEGDRLIGRVEVTLQPQPPGQVGGEVMLKVVSAIRTRTVTVPVSANVFAAVTVAPSRLALPIESGAGRLFSARCIVRATRGVPIIVRIASVPADFTAEVDDPMAATASKIVRVKWTPRNVGAEQQPPQRREMMLVVQEGTAEHRVSIPIDCSDPGEA